MNERRPAAAVKCLNLRCCCRIGGTYTVKTVKQHGSACSQQQAAEDFLRSRLYGPASRRTTCKKQPIQTDLWWSRSCRNPQIQTCFCFPRVQVTSCCPSRTRGAGQKVQQCSLWRKTGVGSSVMHVSTRAAATAGNLRSACSRLVCLDPFIRLEKWGNAVNMSGCFRRYVMDTLNVGFCVKFWMLPLTFESLITVWTYSVSTKSQSREAEEEVDPPAAESVLTEPHQGTPHATGVLDRGTTTHDLGCKSCWCLVQLDVFFLFFFKDWTNNLPQLNKKKNHFYNSDFGVASSMKEAVAVAPFLVWIYFSPSSTEKTSWGWNAQLELGFCSSQRWNGSSIRLLCWW